MVTCEQHDYIEIACTFKLEVCLHLVDGSTVSGKASDTIYNKDKEHCITLKTKSGNKLVVLNTITTMQALQPNPHFELIHFN